MSSPTWPMANGVRGKGALAHSQKPLGKIAQLHAMWQDAGDGELLPRAFAIEMAVAQGVNPSTARTQYQVMYRRAQVAALVEQTPE